LKSGRSKVFRELSVLHFKAAYAPVKLFVLEKDLLNFLESAGAVVHASPLEKERRRAELGQRRTDYVAWFVAELVGAAAGAPVRKQSFTSPTNPPVPGPLGSVPGVEVDLSL
jgi:hypothetical protein